MPMPRNILEFMSMQEDDDPMMGGGATPSQQPGMAQNILASRFQPTAMDAGNAALAGIAGDTYIAPETYVDQRIGNAMKQMAVVAQWQRGAGIAPSSVREYQYYMGLPEMQRNQFMNLKRASQIMNLGDRMAVYDPRTGTEGPSFQKGLPPQEQPELKYRQRREEQQAEIDTAEELAAAQMRGKGEPTPNTLRAEGRKNVTSILTNLQQEYDTLKTKGAITSTGESPASNVSAYLRGTSVGQMGGRMVGTVEQSHRERVKQTRPLLINAIRAATGMSAKAMDSNAEMQFYLQAATDLDAGYEANAAAVRHLDRLYGLGLMAESEETGGEGNAPPDFEALGITPDDVEEYKRQRGIP